MGPSGGEMVSDKLRRHQVARPYRPGRPWPQRPAARLVHLQHPLPSTPSSNIQASWPFTYRAESSGMVRFFRRRRKAFQFSCALPSGGTRLKFPTLSLKTRSLSEMFPAKDTPPPFMLQRSQQLVWAHLWSEPAAPRRAVLKDLQMSRD